MKAIAIILILAIVSGCSSLTGENKIKEAALMGIIAINFSQTEKIMSDPGFESPVAGKDLDVARTLIIIYAIGQLVIANNLSEEEQDKFIEANLVINSMVIGHNQFLINQE